MMILNNNILCRSTKLESQQRRISIRAVLRQLLQLLPEQRDVATERLSQLQVIALYHSYVTNSLIFQHCQYSLLMTIIVSLF